MERGCCENGLTPREHSLGSVSSVAPRGWVMSLCFPSCHSPKLAACGRGRSRSAGIGSLPFQGEITDCRRTQQSTAGLSRSCLLQALLLFLKCFQANCPELWLQDAPNPRWVTQPGVSSTREEPLLCPWCQRLPGGHWHTLVTAQVRDHPRATRGCLKPGGHPGRSRQEFPMGAHQHWHSGSTPRPPSQGGGQTPHPGPTSSLPVSLNSVPEKCQDINKEVKSLQQL